MPAGRQPYLKAARRQAQILAQQHRQKTNRLLQQMHLLPIQKESSLTLISFLERTSLILIQKSLSSATEQTLIQRIMAELHGRSILRPSMKFILISQ